MAVLSLRLFPPLQRQYQTPIGIYVIYCGIFKDFASLWWVHPGKQWEVQKTGNMAVLYLCLLHVPYLKRKYQIMSGIFGLI